MKVILIPAGHAGEGHAALKAATGAEVSEETIAERLRRGGRERTGTELTVNGQTILLAD